MIKNYDYLLYVNDSFVKAKLNNSGTNIDNFLARENFNINITFKNFKDFLFYIEKKGKSLNIDFFNKLMSKAISHNNKFKLLITSDIIASFLSITNKLYNNKIVINPTNLSNLIGAINDNFSSKSLDEKKYNKDAIRPQDISNILNEIGKAQYSTNGLKFKEIEESIKDKIKYFKITNIANALNGFRNIKYQPNNETIKKMCSAFVDLINETFEEIKENKIKKNEIKYLIIGICNTLNSLAEFGFRLNDLSTIYTILYKNINYMNIQDIVMLLGVFKKFGLDINNESLKFNFEGKNINIAVEMFKEIMTKDINDFKNVEICKLINALGCMKAKAEKRPGTISFFIKLTNEFINNISDQSKENAEFVSNILNGLSQVGYKISNENQYSEKLNIKKFIYFINNNIDSFSNIDLSNMLNGLSGIGWKNNESINLDGDKIKNAIINKLESFEIHHIGLILNALRQIEFSNNFFIDKNTQKNYENTDFKQKDINKIVDSLLKKLDSNTFNNTSLSLALNGLSYFCYRNNTNNKERIKKLIETFIKNINNNEECYISLSIFIESIGKIGVSCDEINKDLQDSLIEHVLKNIDNFNFIESLNVFDGLTKIFLYDKEHLQNNYNILEKILNKILVNIDKNIEKFSDNSTYNILSRNLYYLYEINKKNNLKIGDNIKNYIRTHKNTKDNYKESSFERVVDNILTHGSNNETGELKFIKECKVSIPFFGGKFGVFTDFFIENNGEKYIVELDGDTHYDTETGVYFPATIIRNQIIEHMIGLDIKNKYNFVKILSKEFNENLKISSNEKDYSYRLNRFLEYIDSKKTNNIQNKNSFSNYEKINRSQHHSAVLRKDNNFENLFENLENLFENTTQKNTTQENCHQNIVKNKKSKLKDSKSKYGRTY